MLNANDMTDRRDSRSFSAAHGFYMLFWMFLLGSVVGFALEGVWSVIYWGKWSHHVGVVWGPFCTIYGVGAVAMYVFCSLLPTQGKKRWEILLSRFLICAIAGSLVEYLTSLLQEMNFGSTSWDYSHQKFNIGGRISVFMTLVWGAVGLFYMQILCPLMRALIERIQGQSGYVATWAMIVFMSVNLIVSAAAVNRWRERVHDIPAQTAVDISLDRTFDDERMQTLFPNMEFRGDSRPGSVSLVN